MASSSIFDKTLIPISTSFSPPFFDCRLSSTQMLCGFKKGGPDLGPLPVSISGDLVLQTTVPGAVTVQAYIQGRQNAHDPNSANNIANDIANVSPSQFALSITTAGAGSGTVTSNPAGISCPGTCTFSFAQGTPVTLTPAAPAGSAFAGWGGACTGTGACSVTMNAPQSVSATFNLTTVTVTGAGTGNGTVTGTGGISCTSTFGTTSGTCTNTSPINAGATVTLTATPASSLYVFAGWGGPCSGSGACTFAASVVTCPLGSIAAGASATVIMVVTAPSLGWAAQILKAISDALDPNPTNNSARVGPALSSFNTPTGANVVVTAADSSGDTASVSFASVTRAGATTISASAATSAAPAGFRFGTPAVIYDISSNADFTGPVAVALRFHPASFHHPGKVRLFHFENGVWVDRTTGVNLAAATVSAITSTLSPFIVVEPLNNPPVANAGADRSVPGAMAAGAHVTLDGSASVDADSDPLTYRWSGPFPEGGGAVTGINPTVTLPLGVSKVSLVVNDGEADSSAVAVNVAVADFQVSAPAGSVPSPAASPLPLPSPRRRSTAPLARPSTYRARRAPLT